MWCECRSRKNHKKGKKFTCADDPGAEVSLAGGTERCAATTLRLLGGSFSLTLVFFTLARPCLTGDWTDAPGAYHTRQLETTTLAVPTPCSTAASSIISWSVSTLCEHLLAQNSLWQHFQCLCLYWHSISCLTLVWSWLFTLLHIHAWTGVCTDRHATWLQNLTCPWLAHPFRWQQYSW